MKPKFKREYVQSSGLFEDEYILARGWPLSDNKKDLSMYSKLPHGKVKFKIINVPEILYNDDAPEYQLILRRVK